MPVRTPHHGRKRAAFVVAAFLLLTGGNARAQGTVAAVNRAALVALYNATGGANWKTNTNWLSEESLSEWHSVTTDENGRVTELDLEANGLSGEIPAELGDLKSMIAVSHCGSRATMFSFSAGSVCGSSWSPLPRRFGLPGPMQAERWLAWT